MNTTADLEQLPLVWLSGSRAYGLAVDGSDCDVRACRLPDRQAYLTLKRPEDKTVLADGVDRTVFGLHHLLDMLAANRPNVIELAGLPDRMIIRTSPLGEHIRRLAGEALSQRALPGLKGYAHSQYARWVNTGRMGDWGQARKALMHAVRAMRMAGTLWETGVLEVVRGSDRSELLAIRTGRVDGERAWYQACERLEQAAARPSPLRVEPCTSMVRPVLEEALACAMGTHQWG